MFFSLWMWVFTSVAAAVDLEPFVAIRFGEQEVSRVLSETMVNSDSLCDGKVRIYASKEFSNRHTTQGFYLVGKGNPAPGLYLGIETLRDYPSYAAEYIYRGTQKRILAMDLEMIRDEWRSKVVSFNRISNSDACDLIEKELGTVVDHLPSQKLVRVLHDLDEDEVWNISKRYANTDWKVSSICEGAFDFIIGRKDPRGKPTHFYLVNSKNQGILLEKHTEISNKIETVTYIRDIPRIPSLARRRGDFDRIAIRYEDGKIVLTSVDENSACWLTSRLVNQVF